MRIHLPSLICALAAAAPALAQPAAPPPTVPTSPVPPAADPIPATPPSSLPAEPQPAPVVAPAPPPQAAPHAPPATGALPLSRWKTTLYGFAEYDAIHDSTQGLNDGVAHTAIARDGTFAGSHARFTNAVRNSRVGFKLGGPDGGDVKTTAVIELDFMGSQAPGTSEGGVLVNPLFRLRHLNFKVETPVVDLLFGQTWQLFGAQPLFHPNAVEIQGLPAQVYSRAPQLRITKTVKTDALNVELALAAVRPAQRDAGMPDAQGALKLQLNGWKGLHTAGSTGTGVDPLSFAVSGLYRRFELPEFTASPKSTTQATGWGLSVDALIPVIPATMNARGNALTLTGSFVTGRGIADLYAGLTGGVSNASLPNPDKKDPAPTYTANVDPGLVVFTADGSLHAVQWQSWMAGVQYYLPPTGAVWVSANAARIESDDAASYGKAASVFTKADWYDANLFWDVTPAVRLGAEVARFHTTYADGGNGVNIRGQFSAFYLF